MKMLQKEEMIKTKTTPKIQKVYVKVKVEQIFEGEKPMTITKYMHITTQELDKIHHDIRAKLSEGTVFNLMRPLFLPDNVPTLPFVIRILTATIVNIKQK